MELLYKDLKANTTCELRFDELSRRIYSVDASIFEVVPLGVVLPKNYSDLLTTVKIAYRHQVPIVARGAATGIAGGCIGSGLIVDISKYLNSIIEINIEKEYAICEPGVVQDTLNAALSPFGYRLGPDTSTGNRATLGGMTANNSAGSRSLRYGRMVDHVEEVEVILANGEVLTFGKLNPEEFQAKLKLLTTEGHIYREAKRIGEHYQKAIQEHIPDIPKMAAGYNLHYLLHSPFNLAKIITGSEGTLGLITKIKVKIAPKPIRTGQCVVHFHEMRESMDSIAKMLEFKPLALEMIDSHILQMGAKAPSIRSKLHWLSGNPASVFIAEFDGATEEEVKNKLDQFQTAMQRDQIGYAYTLLTEAKSLNDVWDVRKAGLGLLMSKRSYSRAIAFIEDLSIPPSQLPKFIEKFRAYLQKVGKDAGIYGHVGSGCMHIRPYMDLRQASELELMQKMMLDVADMVLESGGSLTGEHGDGFIRTWLNEKMFGKEVYRAFKELKKAFDPDNLMNPGKKVNGPSVTENLRIDPKTKTSEIKTFLDFSREGGFELSVDMCNGNGLCRKQENTMCPSFQATLDEYDSTRARAQALRGVIHGELGVTDLTSPAVHDVLDLCLQCKGCKTECPSQVDMAKMKGEFLYHYQKKYGIPLRSRLFGALGSLLSTGSMVPSFFNWMNNLTIVKKLMGKLGISTHRSLPSIAYERFSEQLKKWKQPEDLNETVVLFNDTYTEFNHPEIGIAALKVLNAMGYKVIVPNWSCCGRPALSKGLLPKAKEMAIKVVEELLPYAQKGIPIIGLEPSCISALMDDYKDLIDSKWAEPVLKASLSFDQFVAANGEGLVFKDPITNVKVHGHCHQKAIVGMEPTLKALKMNPGFRTEAIPSGCCGMAGSFGYESEHYDISMKIGSLKLFPAVRSSTDDTEIVASGFSCRTQITDGTGRKAVHLAELLAKSLKDNERNNV